MKVIKRLPTSYEKFRLGYEDNQSKWLLGTLTAGAILVVVLVWIVLIGGM